MGVPAFYRWLVEKYPKTSTYFLEQRPVLECNEVQAFDLNQPNPNGIEYDNLYIDMNGVIHPCSHPETGLSPKNEQAMFENITRYIDRLVAAVRPRKLLFLAIDGTAPRAKMNQQRTRRYKTAQEAHEKYEKSIDTKNSESCCAVWDSNVITPGTSFMCGLSDFLRVYICKRISQDKFGYWQSIKILFSDAQDPGEGEHKIMDFIRRQRAQPNYDPTLNHILHGLDADLIMLGLSTHEARFTILRELVDFGSYKDKLAKETERNEAAQKYDEYTLGGNCSGVWPYSREELWLFSKPLQRLEIWTLRAYLQLEFSCLKEVPGYDFEHIVDDFVFLCFFVGNDFLPHLPSLDIREGAIDFLLNIYKNLFPKKGYLTASGGLVNLESVGFVLEEVGKFEDEVFQLRKHYEDRDKQLRALSSGPDVQQCRHYLKGYCKNGAKCRFYHDGNSSQAEFHSSQLLPKCRYFFGEGHCKAGNACPFLHEEVSFKNRPLYNNHISSKEASQGPTIDSDSFSSPDSFPLNEEQVIDTVRLWEEGWKERYYADKYKDQNITQGGGREAVFRSYVEGLSWITQYYFCGCPCWKWFYPFHYAPFASDLVDIQRYLASFSTNSNPFKPIHQLMAVLPPSSAAALPESCRWLMLHPDSPIIDFYPEMAPSDPNGKSQRWLWILLLPFIDESRLLEALVPCEELFTPEEKERNVFGPCRLFMHSSHRLARQLLECWTEKCQESILLESSSFDSFFGSVHLESWNSCAASIEETNENPCLDSSNNVLVFRFEGPPRTLPSRDLLCPLDAIMEPPQLTALGPPPVLARNKMSIALLGGAATKKPARNMLARKKDIQTRNRKSSELERKKEIKENRKKGKREKKQAQEKKNANEKVNHFALLLDSEESEDDSRSDDTDADSSDVGSSSDEEV